KLKGEQIVTTEVAEPAPVIDLMAALKKSLETMKPPASSKPTREREAAEEKKAPARGKQKGTSRKAGGNGRVARRGQQLLCRRPFRAVAEKPRRARAQRARRQAASPLQPQHRFRRGHA